MTVSEKLHAKRKTTEEHIRKLESEGKAGIRYTACIPDICFMALGLICDVGWLMQLISGFIIISEQMNGLIMADILIILIGIGFTIYLGIIHEKEIAFRWQKDMSFGLTVLGGIIGIFAGISVGAAIFVVGGLLNTIGGLPIYLSFRKGIRYGVR